MVLPNRNMCLLLLALFCQLLAASAYMAAPGHSQGPYCGGVVCDDRKDDCSHPIYGTLCYCDEFCNRNGTDHDDCCPDYPGQAMAPMALVLQTCNHNGREYYRGETRMDNCNQCTCAGDQWECTTDPCLVEESTIDRVNRQNGGWRAAVHSPFWGRKLSEGFKRLLGTLPLTQQTLNLKPDPSYPADNHLPPSFDARAHWPGYITPVYDQGWCGSDWAVSTAAIASDRFAIQSKGAERVRLSAQQLVSCDVRGQQGCAGGHIENAWGFIRRNGLVDEDCFPYTADMATKSCPRRMTSLRAAGCVMPSYGREALYTSSPPKRLGSVEDIMYEIYTSGPVQAIMKVRPDFFTYNGGIYRHNKNSGSHDMEGLHAVRIVGWGEENRGKYWLVANSWGPEWGENGYFRIARGENESDIENFVLSAIPQVFHL